MSDDGKAGLRERLTLIAHVMPTWTAEVVIAVPVNRAVDEVAAWLRDEAGSALTSLGEAAIRDLANTLDPKETDR